MREQIVNLFVFAGIEPIQYRRIESSLQEENRVILAMVSPIALLIFCALIIGAFFNETMMSRIWLYIVGAVTECSIFVMARSIAKGRNQLTISLVHLFNMILYGFGFAMDIFARSNGASVSFVVVLVICQLVFNVRPLQTGLHSFIAMVLYIIVALQVKSDVALLDDILNVTCFWCAGLALNLMLSNVRARCHWGLVEQSRQKEAVSLALKSADEANKAKTSFLFNMSHDIRTPMNAIIGYTELLEQQIREDQTKQKEYLAKLKISSSYLLNLLDNVLEMSRIESGRIELEQKPSDMKQFMDSLNVVFEAEMKKKHLQFSYSYKVDNQYVYMDQVKVREIALNILGNSVKYTPDGGSISLSLEELPCNQPGYARYRTIVTDTGIGIGKEFLPHLFELFSRERNTTESNIAGTGLGMGIVKNLVDLMGGDIRVESEVGKGTTTYIELTHRLAVEADISAEQEYFPKQAIETELKGVRVLMAEDNDLNAEIAEELLKGIGIEVARAVDGAECIDMLSQSEPGWYDVILMDIQMPNVDGYAATRMIRKMDDLVKRNIPIIAMTANVFAKDRKNAVDAGIDDYVTKPVNMAKLCGCIVGLLHKNNVEPVKKAE